jgi:multimeric flavodoxin WrbA
MNITIINGIKDTQTNPFEMQLELACVRLSKEHKIDLFTIEDMDINYCRGCFGCWLKTPGLCTFKDDMGKILGSVVASDLLLVVSPLDAGFITSEAKKALDRLLPILMPYIKIYGGEFHHIPRYEKRSSLGIIVLDDGSADREALDIVYGTFYRLAKNFHAKKIIRAEAELENLSEVLANEISGC